MALSRPPPYPNPHMLASDRQGLIFTGAMTGVFSLAIRFGRSMLLKAHTYTDNLGASCSLLVRCEFVGYRGPSVPQSTHRLTGKCRERQKSSGPLGWRQPFTPSLFTV